MRTDEEILAKIDAWTAHDWLGTKISELAVRLSFSVARPLLKPDAVEADWKVLPRDRASVLAELAAYMAFAWEKANNCRGISAGRSLDHMHAWLWLMGEDAFLAALTAAPYDRYGKPQLREICEYLKIEWRALDDGNWTNSEGDLGPDADRVPRPTACEQFSAQQAPR